MLPYLLFGRVGNDTRFRDDVAHEENAGTWFESGDQLSQDLHAIAIRILMEYLTE